MTVQDLIETLEGFDPNAEVRIATQPRWPLAHILADVTEAPSVGSDDNIFWLLAGDSPSDSPYAPTDIFDN